MTTSQVDDVSHIDKLTGVDNYQIWKLQIEIIFQSAGLDDVVSGKIKQENLNEDKEIKEFIRKDARAKKIILASISKNVLNHILQCKTSKEMYEKIDKIYDRKNEDQVNELLQKFFAYPYDQSSDVASNISNLQNISFRLNSLNQKITDEMLISKILAILPFEYNNFGTAWSSTEKTERTIDNLMTRLLAEETKISSRKTTEDNVAFKTSQKKINSFQRKNTGNQKCFNCDKPGHFASSCLSKKTAKENEGCKYCKKHNHRSENCYFRAEHEKREKIKRKDKVAYITQKKENDLTRHLKFYVDSGSSSHMINNRSVLNNFKTECDEVKVAKKNQTLPTAGVGSLNTDECILQNVIFAPCLDSNLLSVGAITQNEGQVLFTKEKVVIKKFDQVIEGRRQSNGLYAVNLTLENSDKQCLQVVNIKKDATYWHKTLGHLSYENIEKLNRRYCFGISATDFENIENICDICVKAKQTRFPFCSERTRASRPLEIIHTDICKIEIPTWDGYFYILTCLDDFTCFKQIYLLKNKSETAELIKEYVREVESKWTLPVYKIRCDNGGEYVNENLLKWAKTRGTVMDFTIAHTPQLNAKAERLNRSILDKTRALLFESKLPAEMWGEAARVACYILNRCPTKSLPDTKTPFEMWFGKTPNYERMHLFGCYAHAKILNKKKKLDSRSKKYRHVGYTLNGYRLWDENARKIIYSRDVIFEEKIPEAEEENLMEYDNVTIFHEKDKNHEDIEESQKLSVHINKQQRITNDAENSNTETVKEITSNEDDELEEELTSKEENTNKIIYKDGEENDEEKINIEKRKRSIPNYLQDYVLLTYQEAVNGPDSEEWKKAIEKEKSALQKNEVFKFIPRNEVKDNKLISSKWVFRKKENGKFKARLVARGCEQREGDYYETYSPVVNTDSLRFLLAYATSTKRTIMTFDVASAFLHGQLSEELYMKLPEGFDEEKGKVCLLQRSLYGLKQAPINWNRRFVDFIKKKGLIQLMTDKSVFKNEDNSLILAVHVDDGLVIGDNPKIIENFLLELTKEFDITFEKEPKVYIGMELENSSENLVLHQGKYIDKILSEFRMESSKSVRTPSIPKSEFENVKPNKIFPYREAVGSLLYLSNRTRPDITFSVNAASRKVENPSEGDVLKVKRIFRYLQGTKDMAISYAKNQDYLQLDAYCDSDYANDPDTRRSTSGFVILYCGGAISWSTRRQQVVATSTAEAEFISASECVKEVLFLKALFKELTNQDLNVNLYIDNLSTINMIKNSCDAKRSKHIDIKYKFILEKVNQNNLNLKHCPSDIQIADAFTKSLTPVNFEKLRNEFIFCKKEAF